MSGQEGGRTGRNAAAGSRISTSTSISSRNSTAFAPKAKSVPGEKQPQMTEEKSAEPTKKSTVPKSMISGITGKPRTTLAMKNRPKPPNETPNLMTKSMNVQPGENWNGASRSGIQSKAISAATTLTGPRSRPSANLMSKSVGPSTKVAERSSVKATNAERKKRVELANPDSGPNSRSSTAKLASRMGSAVFHVETGEEAESAKLHPAILKQARQTGSLNLSDKGLAAVPDQVWTLNESDDVDKKRGFSIDRVEEDNWWERVDLTKLILASNQITNISPRIGDLLSLTVLDLHDNNIGFLPDEIGRLENLTKINLSHNKLTFLPVGFYGLRNLRSLNACHNELNELSDDMSRLDMLEGVDVAFNKLVEFTPASLASLSRVTSLTANNNNLSSVPDDIAFMRSLNVVELSHNKLEKLTESVGQLAHVERLYLHHNRLKQMPNLKNCQHLKEVHLGYNFIEEFTEIDIENMPGVKLIDLRDNKVRALPDEVVSLQSLERLDLSNNDLATLPFSLGTLPHLKSLQVDGNPMKSIRRDIIARGTVGLLKYLRSRIDDDELARLSSTANGSELDDRVVRLHSPLQDKFSMKSSHVMNLSGKELAVLPTEAVANAIEADVASVDLSKNRFDALPVQLETLMSQISELNLSSNRLTDLNPSLMGMAAKLQYLNLANNKLARLPEEIGSLAALREVCLNCNRFESVPSCLYSCANIETIMMSDNRVAFIDVDGLKRLSRLAILDLANNNIANVPPELGLVKSLRSLQLEGNAFRVPRPQILVKGTESVMAYLRDRIPRTHSEPDNN